MLSRRVISGDSHGQNSSYFVGWQEYEKNPYHEVDNPTGIVQMGLAENQVRYYYSTYTLSIPYYTKRKMSFHCVKM